MYISYSTMNRFVEDKKAEDPEYRALIEKSGRPYLSLARNMSDYELVSKLRQLGLKVSRGWLLDTFPRFISAEAMACAMLDNAPSDIEELQTDWVWIVLTTLWERWRPELASMEGVNDKMQAGYAARKQRDVVRACTLWVETWHAILDIMARAGIDSLDAFDDRFGGVNCLFNWVQDFNMELHNAGIEDRRFFRERIALCETMIRRFPTGKLSLDNFKSALAESHFHLGDRETGDRLFRRWVDDDPQNGPWVTWSDCYWIFAADGNKDAARAERILKEGLAVPGAEDRTLSLSRLATIYEETARPEEAKALHAEIARLNPPKKTPIPPKPAPSLAKETQARHEDLENVHPPKSPLGTQKVGRNEPCPCGSGKKFKKCCGG
jgi:tetratricopeptide (TPR) repeat protein